MKNKIYILKPKVGSALHTFVESLRLDDNQKNCCYLVAYYFYRKYILDTDQSKFINREYTASSRTLDSLIGSSNWRSLRKLILWNDRIDGATNRKVRIIYTNGSYVGDIKGKTSRSMKYSLNKRYILEDEWEQTLIDKPYIPRNSKKDNLKTKLSSTQWKEALSNEYRQRIDRLTMDSKKAHEVVQRANLLHSSKFTDVLVCDITNFENETNRVTRSDKVHRLYSKVTNMKSELRYPILWDGESTIILDIKSCSAYMLYPLIKDDIEKGKWCSWLRFGFYENLSSKFNISRDDAKDAFSVWQGGVWDKGNALLLEELVQNELPIFHKYLSDKRERAPKILSYYSQQTDAKIVVDDIVLNSNIGFESISIHDAILIKEKDKDVALDAIIKTVEKHIGIKPRVKVEDPLQDLPELPKSRLRYKINNAKEPEELECLDELLASLE